MYIFNIIYIELIKIYNISNHLYLQFRSDNDDNDNNDILWCKQPICNGKYNYFIQYFTVVAIYYIQYIPSHFTKTEWDETLAHIQ